MWVPTLLGLSPEGGVPTGCVFSAMMMAITIGGMLFGPFHKFLQTNIVGHDSANEVCATLIYSLAGVTMAVPAIALSSSSTTEPWFLTLILASFMLVEFCVGFFMPVAGTLRSKYVPDALQGAILNIFRLPLNIIVVSGTYASDVLEAPLVFKLVSGCFFAAAAIQFSMVLAPGPSTTSSQKKQD